MKLLLDPHGKYSERVPTEYELRIAQQTVANTFVFSEKDFAGFKGKGKNGVKGEGADRKEGIVGSQSKIDKSRRFQPYYKKAIPSRLHDDCVSLCRSTDMSQNRPSSQRRSIRSLAVSQWRMKNIGDS